MCDFQPSASDAYAHNRLQLFGLLALTQSKNDIAVKFVKKVMMGNIKEKNLQQAKFN